jgi:hypothetical protein
MVPTSLGETVSVPKRSCRSLPSIVAGFTSGRPWSSTSFPLRISQFSSSRTTASTRVGTPDFLLPLSMIRASTARMSSRVTRATGSRPRALSRTQQSKVCS